VRARGGHEARCARARRRCAPRGQGVSSEKPRPVLEERVPKMTRHRSRARCLPSVRVDDLVGGNELMRALVGVGSLEELARGVDALPERETRGAPCSRRSSHPGSSAETARSDAIALAPCCPGAVLGARKSRLAGAFESNPAHRRTACNSQVLLALPFAPAPCANTAPVRILMRARATLRNSHSIRRSVAGAWSRTANQ
jgi:hypothetical protein